jgi:spore coat protein CotH
MRHRLALALAAGSIAVAAGCSADSAKGDTSRNEDATSATTDDAIDLFDERSVHELSIDVDPDDLESMLDAFTARSEKIWVAADVTIDGTLYRQAGIRLKGNSSLFGLGGGVGEVGLGGPAGGEIELVCDNAEPSSTSPTGSDTEFVADQQHQGRREFVVRSNNTTTALNEAVALDLLGAAGLATQQAALVALTVNDSEPMLRLVIESPDDGWADANLGEGALFKADASGNYTYRGDDPDDYSDAWDQDARPAGAVDDDYGPLIEFLDFVNNATDAEFAAGLVDRLDVEAFARYLAIEDLLGNFDDIAGPGNNSYLYFDAEGVATVVAWDHNLAFTGLPTMPGASGGPGSSNSFPPLPGGCTFPDGFDPADLPTPPSGGGGLGAIGMGGNVLVERFNKVPEFEEMYDTALAELTTKLFVSGDAGAMLDTWTDIAAASGLVDEDIVSAEATRVRDSFPA